MSRSDAPAHDGACTAPVQSPFAEAMQPHAAAQAGRPWVYLASQSPRRLQLLNQWGVDCVPLLHDAVEEAGHDPEALEAVLPGDTPRAYVQRVTRLKLAAALARLQRRKLPPGVVLCADTTVALGRQILGKPTDAHHARQMLASLAGRRHRVLTAVAVGRWPSDQDGQAAPGPHHGQADQPWVWTGLSESHVTFAPMSADVIDHYVASGEPFGKAGGYGIQGLAALWVSHISGSYSGIMGLPAFETANVLRQAGVPLP